MSEAIDRIERQLKEALSSEIICGRLDLTDQVAFQGLDVEDGYFAVLTVPDAQWSEYQLEHVGDMLRKMIRDLLPLEKMFQVLVLPMM